MLPLAIVLLLLTVAFGVLGHGGVAVPFAGAAQVLFIVFVVLFLLCAVAAATRERPRT